MRALTALAAVLLMLAGCGSDDTDAAGFTVTTYAPTPSPSAEEADAIEGAVNEIYPGVPDGKAADWAEMVCSRIVRDGLTGTRLTDYVIARFSGGDRPALTAEQAGAIVDVIDGGGWCVQP